MSAEQFSETATRVPEEPGPKEYFAVTPLTTCPHVDQLSVKMMEILQNYPFQVDPIKISAEGFNAMEKCKKCANVGENWVCLKCMEVCKHFSKKKLIKIKKSNRMILKLNKSNILNLHLYWHKSEKSGFLLVSRISED